MTSPTIFRERIRQVAAGFLARTPFVGGGLRWFRRRRERRNLDALPRLDAGPVDRLRKVTPVGLRQALDCDRRDCMPLDERLGSAIAITGPGAVNPGDRFALAHLVLRWQPERVLEVGTHVGASTTSIALALDELGQAGTVDTVDIQDVNDPSSRPRGATGAGRSPREALRRLGVEDRVRFHTSDSLEFLARSEASFDLIFLDGDHSASTVYREIPAACARLREGGVILLHDYFPAGRPLWASGELIPGPWLAVERLRNEGVPIRALPLGALPWPTRPDSRHTSLALLTRDT